jgi:Flp pilus assembly protein TadD
VRTEKRGLLDAEARPIVPRWRPFDEALRRDDLSASTTASRAPQLDSIDTLNYERSLQEFRENRSAWFGGNVFVEALARDDLAAAAEIGTFLLSGQSDASPMLRELATQHLNPEDIQPESTANYRVQIGRLRHRLRVFPRNGIAWADLGYHLNLAGQFREAGRALAVAVQLAPNNRFVLRAAARFHIHHERFEQAQAILNASAATSRDPWLLAAEIGAATSGKRRSRHLQHARTIVKDGVFSPLQSSELASAVGTAELLFEAPRRQIRTMFAASLQDPTENSLAQAEWAARRCDGITEKPRLDDRVDTHEARAWDNFVNGKFDDAATFAQAWLKDQPFAPMPAQLLSWILSSLNDDYTGAIDILRRALRPNPNDSGLLNNIAFSYASLNETRKARIYIERAALCCDDDDEDSRLIIAATRGLIAFREHRPDQGRSLYLDVIERAMTTKADNRIAAMAWTHLAREEVLAQSDFAPTAAAKALDHGHASKEVTVRALIDHVEPILVPLIATRP